MGADCGRLAGGSWCSCADDAWKSEEATLKGCQTRHPKNESQGDTAAAGSAGSASAARRAAHGTADHGHTNHPAASNHDDHSAAHHHRSPSCCATSGTVADGNVCWGSCRETILSRELPVSQLLPLHATSEHDTSAYQK